MSVRIKSIYLPALRGYFGDWVYYSCLVPLYEVAERVDFAHDIHNNKNLSEMIQRSLLKGRGKDISEYLITQKERFFNSLVLAVYGGDPTWLEFGNIKSANNKIDISSISSHAIDGLGILFFSGKEKIFALDGQHRLSGIKLASKCKGNFLNEDVPVIFVAHKKTQNGLRRTRRLFTTLNKTAKPVSKGEIISLDEDDVMAITVRRLVEECSFFSNDKIRATHTNNIPVNDIKCITTIGNLYDILILIFRDIKNANIKSTNKSKILYRRPDDEVLDEYKDFAIKYFTLLSKVFKPLKTIFDSKNSEMIIPQYRNKSGGHIIFRPIGLEIITRVIVALFRKNNSLEDSIKKVSKLPYKIEEKPFRFVVWDPRRKTIITKGKKLAQDLLLYILNEFIGNKNELKQRYADALGKPLEEIELPRQVDIAS
jgi:DNA sulfur modification protein DndB